MKSLHNALQYKKDSPEVIYASDFYGTEFQNRVKKLF